LSLLAVAREAGLTVRVGGDRLVVRGPRAAEALAREVLQHKAELMVALRPAASPEAEADPVDTDTDNEQPTPAPARRRPPPPTDPGASCPVHKRLLTFAESVAGACSWCSGAVQLDHPARAPAPRACLECGEPLPAGNKYFCWDCVAARAECADREVPF